MEKALDKAHGKETKLVLIALAVGAFVALSPSTWREAVHDAFGERSLAWTTGSSYGSGLTAPLHIGG